MKNPTKGNHNYSYSSKSPSFLSKIKSCFRPHKSSNRGLLSRDHYGVHKAPSPPATPSKPVSQDKPNTKTSSSSPTILKKPVSQDNANTKTSSSSPTILKKPVSQDKPNTKTSSSSPTILKKPVYKPNTKTSSSSPTILKNPVSQPTVPPPDSKQNTDPSMSEAARTLAAGAGKLATWAGKLALGMGEKVALLTAGVVKDGIGIAAHQIEHNEKLKETFACYYTDRNERAYQGTLNFSNNQIIFSTDLPILPPGSSYKTKESELKLELKISFREVIEINQMNAENPSTRYIQIRRVQGSNYAFGGFVDYYKAYNHIYSLLQSSS